MNNLLIVLKDDGETKFEWDPISKNDMKQANTIFEEMTQIGYIACRTKRDGSQSELIREFDPKAETIMLIPPIIGG